MLYSVMPRFTPLIMAILASGLLAFGIYHHYTLFKNEYMKSTWQNGLKMYAPAIMIGFVIILIFYGIFSFFARGAVPIPVAPEVPTFLSPPSPNKNITLATIGSPITSAVNAVTNVANTIGSSISNTMKNTFSNNRKNTRSLI